MVYLLLLLLLYTMLVQVCLLNNKTHEPSLLPPKLVFELHEVFHDLHKEALFDRFLLIAASIFLLP
jgi:hypothetical protein